MYSMPLNIYPFSKKFLEMGVASVALVDKPGRTNKKRQRLGVLPGCCWRCCTPVSHHTRYEISSRVVRSEFIFDRPQNDSCHNALGWI